MIILFENLNEFLEEIKTEAGKGTPAYLSMITKRDQAGNVESWINIQVIDDSGNALSYRYTDLPDYRIISPSFYDLALDEQNAKVAKESYEKSIADVKNKINTEYEKIKRMLTEKIGFKKITEALIQ